MLKSYFHIFSKVFDLTFSMIRIYLIVEKKVFCFYFGEKKWHVGKKLFQNRFETKSFLRDNGRCRACGIGDPDALQADHIMPESKGGTDSLDNLQALCGVCNNRKGSTDIGELPILPAIDGFGDFSDVMAKRSNFVAMVADKRQREIAQLYRIAQNWLDDGVKKLTVSKRLKKIAHDRTADKIMRHFRQQ